MNAAHGAAKQNGVPCSTGTHTVPTYDTAEPSPDAPTPFSLSAWGPPLGFLTLRACAGGPHTLWRALCHLLLPITSQPRSVVCWRLLCCIRWRPVSACQIMLVQLLLWWLAGLLLLLALPAACPVCSCQLWAFWLCSLVLVGGCACPCIDCALLAVVSLLWRFVAAIGVLACTPICPLQHCRLGRGLDVKALQTELVAQHAHELVSCLSGSAASLQHNKAAQWHRLGGADNTSDAS